MNLFKQLTPSGRLWLVTVVLLALLFTFAPRNQEIVIKSNGATVRGGEVVMYYENEYQKHAIKILMDRGQVEQWSCLYTLWTRESNWRPKAYNKSSKTMGIAQFKPQTWHNVGYKPTWNGYVQVDAGFAYIDRRWGGNMCKALAHSLAKGYY